MSLVLLIQSMREAGVADGDILRTVEAYEAKREAEAEEARAVKRSKDAERQRRHRLSRVVTPVTRDTCDPAAPLVPPSSSPPTPPLTTTPLKPPTTHSLFDAGESAKPDGWPSDAITQFWTLYPHKTGKPVALRSLAKCRSGGVPFEQIMDGLRRYIRDKPADRPWLNPSTFLNQARYDDQPAASATTTTQGSTTNDRKAAFRTALDKFRGRAPVGQDAPTIAPDGEEIAPNLFRVGRRE